MEPIGSEPITEQRLTSTFQIPALKEVALSPQLTASREGICDQDFGIGSWDSPLLLLKSSGWVEKMLFFSQMGLAQPVSSECESPRSRSISIQFHPLHHKAGEKLTKANGLRKPPVRSRKQLTKRPQGYPPLSLFSLLFILLAEKPYLACLQFLF